MPTPHPRPPQPLDSGARFHQGGRRRLALWRNWNYDKSELVVIGMNPSTAGAEMNDPTVTRLLARAWLLGLGGLRVVNLMDLVLTDSLELEPASRKTRLCSPENRELLQRLVSPRHQTSTFLAMWGSEGQRRAPDMAEEVEELAERADVTLYCLGTNADGSPRHGLYEKIRGWDGLGWYRGAPPF